MCFEGRGGRAFPFSPAAAVAFFSLSFLSLSLSTSTPPLLTLSLSLPSLSSLHTAHLLHLHFGAKDAGRDPEQEGAGRPGVPGTAVVQSAGGSGRGDAGG